MIFAIRVFQAVLCGSLLLTGSLGAWAQSYPNRPVRIVVPFPAGGATDVLARAIAPKLGEALGQPVIVENRPGAAATMGTDHVAKAAPDGYTLVMGISSSIAVAPVFTKVPYDPVRDFSPVVNVASSPFILVVNPAVSAQSVRELIELAKAKPGQLNMASFGTGSSSHLAGELFKAMAGINLVHVPYKGGPPALQDLIGGRVQVMFDLGSSVRVHVASGKLRELAITSTKRSPANPQLPAVAETVTGYEASIWLGFLVPARTPDEIVRRLNKEIVTITRSAELQKFFAAREMDPVGSTPEQFGETIKQDLAKWAKVVKDSGARPE